MKKNSISEFELERQDFKIRLKRSNSISQVEEKSLPGIDPEPVSKPQSFAQLPSAGGAPVLGVAEVDIKSPMVGTFYLSPSPESARYVEVGSEVNPETVVCIIEAMKVMNEIKAEVKGVITKVLVDNANCRIWPAFVQNPSALVRFQQALAFSLSRFLLHVRKNSCCKSR